jgi:hypothetical protein
MAAKSRTVMPVVVIFFLGIAAVTAWALAGYVLAGELAIAVIAMALWPRWIAYQFRQGMFGAGGEVVTRVTSLGLSTPRTDAVPADNYGNYEPTYEHWLNAYSGVSILIILLGFRGRNWQATLAAAVILLIGRFVLLDRVRRDSGTSGVEQVRQ